MPQTDRRRAWLPVVVTGGVVAVVLALMWWDRPPAQPQPVEKEPTVVIPTTFVPQPSGSQSAAPSVPRVVHRLPPKGAAAAVADLTGGRILVWATDRTKVSQNGKYGDIAAPPLLLKLDGTIDREFALPDTTDVSHGLLAPDGTRLAYSGVVEWVGYSPALGREQLFLRTLGRYQPDEHAVADGGLIAWSGDGRFVYVTGSLPSRPDSSVSYRLEISTGELIPLPFPTNCSIFDVSPDGKRFFVHHWTPASSQYRLLGPDGSRLDDVNMSTRGQYWPSRFSPDGGRVLCVSVPDRENGPCDPAPVAVYDVRARSLTPVMVQGVPPQARVQFGRVTSCWSPDGKRIAFAWQNYNATTTEPQPWNLTVADADGRTASVIFSTTDRDIQSLDWR